MVNDVQCDVKDMLIKIEDKINKKYNNYDWYNLILISFNLFTNISFLTLSLKNAISKYLLAFCNNSFSGSSSFKLS